MDFAQRYGPVAIVTGASSGIGLAFARALAARGLDLVLVARRADRLEALARDINAETGRTAKVLPVDLAAPDAADAIAQATAGQDIGLVVSNAGFGAKGPFEAAPAETLRAMIAVNCTTPTLLAHALLPRLRARGRGGLILTASVEGLIGCPYSAVYSASKAMVIALGEALWGEYQGCGVDILTLCPGATESEAAARQGVDPAMLTHQMAAADVARIALDALPDHISCLPSAHYAALFEQLVAMPRRDALTAMARSMAPRP